MNEIAPEGFIRFSEAVQLLAQGIWGGLPRPEPVRRLKKQTRQALSVGFGPWKEKAGRCLALAGVTEAISIYVFGYPQAETGRPGPEIMRVPGAVLSRLIKVRGTFPDHPRASMKAVAGNGELYRAINTGLLVVRRTEIDVWYRQERGKGRWPSQHHRLKKQGRPSQQTEVLKNAVTTVVQEGRITVAELRRRLPPRHIVAL
jgi:hypothetical protein